MFEDDDQKRLKEKSSEPASDRHRDRPKWDEDFDDDSEFSTELGRVSGAYTPQAVSGIKITGWVALALAVISLFAYPGVFGSAAVLIGLYAFVRGSRSLGGWAMVIGVIALVAYWVFAPLTM
ncbi:hypothetical protein [Gorillibacterium massiliense]|uniref:hypothetical protein n=1 Tax=Gorillibacterium massiliense TaxID=1280390 RepID=UPI0004B0EB2E|nr:hypothetical protein [Gorillibacterium massiliense]